MRLFQLLGSLCQIVLLPTVDNLAELHVPWVRIDATPTTTEDIVGVGFMDGPDAPRLNLNGGTRLSRRRLLGATTQEIGDHVPGGLSSLSLELILLFQGSMEVRERVRKVKDSAATITFARGRRHGPDGLVAVGVHEQARVRKMRGRSKRSQDFSGRTNTPDSSHDLRPTIHTEHGSIAPPSTPYSTTVTYHCDSV